ncbi:uncharacterized protein LOC110417946 isoform X2 [Herrania umbratica]|nr:uncharacterized protein LOC110417946 isoform X2 [Herrania umbratica]XP_021286244.1 uncharacterized protein LOC110417946 isoform X2 [Herrania umbratica]XP_021286253.1 uncharacterized protein LOC110417946 isoform X2 [Herrania umbratica]
MKGSSSNEAAAKTNQVPLHKTKRKGRKRKEADPVERKIKKNKYDRDRRAALNLEFQRLQTVEAQFKQMQDKYTELKGENEELRSMRPILENHVIERNPSLHGMEARTNQLSSGWQLTKIEELKRLHNVESQWTQLCTEFKQMEEYVKTLRNATDSLANDNEILNSRVTLLENEIEELRSNLHQKTEELKRLQNVESQSMQQSTQFWQLQEDFTMLRNSNDSLVKENEFLNSQVPLLENEIEQLKSILHQKVPPRSFSLLSALSFFLLLCFSFFFIFFY